jgi:hypothetical protein
MFGSEYVTQCYPSLYSDRLVAGRPVSIPGKGKSFSLLHRALTGSEAHSAPYLMGTGGCFPGIKAAEA